MDVGIDYGNGMTNLDLKTGIHYGVIPVIDILEAWAECCDPIYSNCCPYCGNEPKNGHKPIEEYAKCPSCKKVFKDGDFGEQEPIGFEINQENYKAIEEGDEDIFVMKSPYYTTCQYCSPCAPGAGYLRNFIENGIKTYCFGHEFFEGGKAPYKIYSVETEKEVLP